MRYQRAEFPLKLDCPEAVRNFFAGCFADSDPARESLWVAHLDGQFLCVHLSRHGGNETGADLPLRSIIVDVVAHGSAGIVLAHSHPSGDERPSYSDCRATRKLATAAGALNCRILDHLIYSDGKISSFQQLGLL